MVRKPATAIAKDAAVLEQSNRNARATNSSKSGSNITTTEEVLARRAATSPANRTCARTCWGCLFENFETGRLYGARSQPHLRLLNRFGHMAPSSAYEHDFKIPSIACGVILWVRMKQQASECSAVSGRKLGKALPRHQRRIESIKKNQSIHRRDVEIPPIFVGIGREAVSRVPGHKNASVQKSHPRCIGRCKQSDSCCRAIHYATRRSDPISQPEELCKPRNQHKQIIEWHGALDFTARLRTKFSTCFDSKISCTSESTAVDQKPTSSTGSSRLTHERGLASLPFGLYPRVCWRGPQPSGLNTDPGGGEV